MIAPLKKYKIVILPGDGIGPEGTAEARKVLDVISDSIDIEFDISEHLFGGSSIDVHGVPLAADVLAEARNADAVLAGAVGGPKWSGCVPRPEDGLLQLRQGLSAYANLRPCRFASKSLHHIGVLPAHVVEDSNFVIVRENCGGAYFGEKVEEEDFASDAWAYTRTEIQRLALVAGALAMENDPPLPVISCDKANVLASSRLWRKVVSQTFAEEFPKVRLSHQLADSAAMLMIKNPRSFNGIVLADNTFGDILSDVASVIPGSLGLLPSASLCGVPVAGQMVKGFYEPVHGSAPDIAGKGVSNPVATVLSLAMLLRYSCGLAKEADAIDEAICTVLSDRDLGGLGLRTGDLGGRATTSEVGDAICDLIRRRYACS